MADNKLRIIGGLWRGRKFQFPNLAGIRPTPDRVRETLFNWLSPMIEGANCLDLFSGSGALTLEALSRGAHQVTSLDLSSQALAALHQHLAGLGCNSARLVQADAVRWLEAGEPGRESFDLVFLDPPFNQGLLNRCCALLERQGLLRPGAYIYLEAEPELRLDLPPGWRLHREKRAGRVAYYLCIRSL